MRSDESGAYRLAHDYAYALDHQDYDLLREIFVPDAEWRFKGVAQVKRLEDILQIPVRLARSFDRTHHAIQTQRIVFDGDVAKGVTYCMAYHVFKRDFVDEGRDQIEISNDYLIRYHDEYRRSHGVWRFSARQLNVIWRAARQVTASEDLPPPPFF